MPYQELLFPGGSMDTVRPVYQEGVVAGFYNESAGKIKCIGDVFGLKVSDDDFANVDTTTQQGNATDIVNNEYIKPYVNDNSRHM